MFDFSKSSALLSIMIMMIAFILYIMSARLFSHLLFWPFHALWQQPNWLQLISQALLISWMCVVALYINLKQRHILKYKKGVAENLQKRVGVNIH